MKFSSFCLQALFLFGVAHADQKLTVSQGNIIRIMNGDKCLTVPAGNGDMPIFAMPSRPVLSFQECISNIFNSSQLFSVFPNGAILSQSNNEYLAPFLAIFGGGLSSENRLTTYPKEFHGGLLVYGKVIRQHRWGFYGESLDSVIIKNENDIVVMHNLTVADGKQITGDRFKIVDVVAVAPKQ